MQRAIDLAYLAEGTTSPNPQVGAILVYKDRIIGEGYHKQHGESHAEVLALRSVKPEDQRLIRESTLYVTLEPCCVFGRTPPCTDLIIKHQIPQVVVSAIDRSPGVNHRGIETLQSAGIQVITGVLEEKGSLLAAQRNTFVASGRPYILLKFAMSRDGYMGNRSTRVILSNAFSQRLVHRIRRKMDAILVGTQTVLTDDPLLTNRLYPGKSPMRIIIDLNGRIPEQSQLMATPEPLWIFRSPDLVPPTCPDHVRYIPSDPATWSLQFMLKTLRDASITGLLVEGGATLLNSFIREGLWDEAMVISCPIFLGEGIQGPSMPGNPSESIQLLGDEWSWFWNRQTYGPSTSSSS